MTTLVVGASGATGRKVVEQLLNLNEDVKIIVRNIKTMPETITNNQKVLILNENILEIEPSKLTEYVKDCDTVVSCLGHNLNFNGLFGKPRRLVTDAVKRLCIAIKDNHSEQKVKFLLMNTAGNRNLDLKEKISFKEKIIIGVLRFLLPPHADNVQAADYLRTRIGQNDKSIEWVVVRPDSLIDEESVSEYEIFSSPVRSAIFNSGSTSRVNVADFMVDLIRNDETWIKWKGQMPVIYNK